MTAEAGHASRPALLSALLALASSGCAPPVEDDPDAAPDGPHVVSVVPEDGAEGVPVDSVIRVRMSDHLDERSLETGRLTLRSGNISLWVMSFYDPVRRELVVWPSSRMRRFSTWYLSIEEGIRGIDGDEVAPVTVTTFRTGDETGGKHPFERQNYPEHVRPIFASSCASCHAGPGQSFAGLALDSAEGVATTLLGSPAEGWPGWKRAAPGRPGESYLLYKLIGDHRIAGLRMPRTMEGDGSPPPLPLEDRRIIADWLASGASFFD